MHSVECILTWAYVGIDITHTLGKMPCCQTSGENGDYAYS